MNLMGMVNGLNRMDDTNPFSPTAFLLAVKLIDLFNRLLWADEVAIDLNRMSVMAKCTSRHSTIRARDELIERGLLVVVAKGKKGQPSFYRLHDISEFGANFAPNPAPNPAPINRLDKTIQDKTIQRESKGGRAAATSRSRFTPPTVEEVRAYCEEKSLKTDPERFMAYYKSNGWMVGKTKMQDWQAAVQGWELRDKNPSGAAKGGKVVREQQYTQRPYDHNEDALDRLMNGTTGGDSS